MALRTNGTKKTTPAVKKTTEDLFDQHTQGDVAEPQAEADTVVPIEAIEKPTEPKTAKKRGTATTRVTKKTGSTETAVTETSESVENQASVGADVKVGEVSTEKKEDTKPKATRAKAKKEEPKVGEKDTVEGEIKVSFELPKHLDPNAVGTVGVTGSRTINLGNYESAKIEVHLALPTAIADIDGTYEYASKWVEAKLEEAIPAPTTVTRTVPNTPKTVVHGDDKPVTQPRTTQSIAQHSKPATTTTTTTQPATKPREQQQGDVGGRLPAGYEAGSIHDPNAHYHEDL